MLPSSFAAFAAFERTSQQTLLEELVFFCNRNSVPNHLALYKCNRFTHCIKRIIYHKTNKQNPLTPQHLFAAPTRGLLPVFSLNSYYRKCQFTSGFPKSTPSPFNSLQACGRFPLACCWTSSRFFAKRTSRDFENFWSYKTIYLRILIF